MRSLWDDEQQSSPLVRDSMRRRGTHGTSMELGVRERRWSPALLRRSPRSGIYQPLVRISLHALEAGFQPAHSCKVGNTD